MKTLSSRQENGFRFPGFDGLRLIAATSVIFSHAFFIADGSDQREPLRQLLGPQNIIGLYGVFTFFIISGFLLARSLSLSQNKLQFCINRWLRIYPGFLFCIVLTIMIFVPILSGSTRLGDSETYGYISASVTCLCDVPLSFTANKLSYLYGGTIYGDSVNSAHFSIENGSLWSLNYEVISYVFLVFLWILFRRAMIVAAAILAVAIFTFVFNSLLYSIAYTLPYFAGGVVMYAIYELFGTNKYIAIVNMLILFFSATLGFQHIAFAISGSYLVVFFAERPNFASLISARVGDWSYGLYLFGWPAEQATQQLLHLKNGWILFLYSFPIATLLAAISWHVVEKPCLRLKEWHGWRPFNQLTNSAPG